MANEKLLDEVEKLDDPNNNNKKKNKKLRYLINIVLVLIATGVALTITLAQDFNSIISNIRSADWTWMLATIGLVFGGMIIRSFTLFFSARLYTRDYHFYQAMANDQIGTFYNAVTPGASGGQVMQAYTYKKQGVPISSAISVLAMNSIIYQVVLIIYGVISFVVKYDFISSLSDIPFDIAGLKFSIPIWPLTIIGFGLNVMVILLVFLMAYWHKFHNFIMGPCVTLCKKLRLVKDPDKTRENLRIQVDNFKVEFRHSLANIPFTLLVAFLTFGLMTLLFSVPYFVGGALHNESLRASFWDAIFLSNYHQMITGLIPIPGSAGISEYFFLQLFLNYNNPELGFYYCSGTATLGAADASKAMASAALLMWRTFTFTIPLLIAGFVTAFYHASPKEHAENSKSRGLQRDTLYSLQNETMVLRQEDVDALEETTRLQREAIKAKLSIKDKVNKTKQNKKDKESLLNKDFDTIDTTKEVDDKKKEEDK